MTRNFRFFPVLSQEEGRRCAFAADWNMKNFSNASFAPDVIAAMTAALVAAIATLPEPLHSGHVDVLAQSILRTASSGERNVTVLQRIALMELSLADRI